MRNDQAGHASSSMRVDRTVQRAKTSLDSVVAVVTATSIQPIPPEKRGRATVMAHGSVDTRNIAAHVPDADSWLLAPALTTSSKITRHTQLVRPGTIEETQCTNAI